MRVIILALLLFFFVGMAGAAIPNATYANFGPYGGFRNPATIETNGLYVHTGEDIGQDLKVWGSVNVVGILTTAGPTIFGTTTTSTNVTLVGTSSKSVYFVGAANGQRISLPIVSGDIGVTYTFVIITGSTGSHQFVIDGAGAETINGVIAFACPTQYASVTVVCTGTNWIITSIGNVGTWTPYTGV